MQSVSSRIWTRVAVSISYDDNHYSTGASYENNEPKMYEEIIDENIHLNTHINGCHL